MRYRLLHIRFQLCGLRLRRLKGCLCFRQLCRRGLALFSAFLLLRFHCRVGDGLQLTRGVSVRLLKRLQARGVRLRRDLELLLRGPQQRLRRRRALLGLLDGRAPSLLRLAYGRYTLGLRLRQQLLRLIALARSLVRQGPSFSLVHVLQRLLLSLARLGDLLHVLLHLPQPLQDPF
eukprot:COSAG05_NODE_2777_length_2649_cov_4.256471_1_plen_175_part_10